ncbi:MAG: DUF4351 domain-containing protein [Aphanocapsa lilacina HA4352-LM1]|jgi:hypothetical protein|nr:DUF4351 domain-containing protein [Aphanocapsa lilacina HA4352-LM1]
MSRTRHDQFAKELLAGLLETVGLAQTEVNVTSEVRRIDLLFVPLPEKADLRQRLGLLGRIAANACLIEPYRNPPTAEEICACLLKLFIQHAERQRQARRDEQTVQRADYERLWVIGPTISETVLADFGAQRQDGWEPGIYFTVAGLRAVLVAVHRLPGGRETLWLRVLGRGRVQQQAIEEVLALEEADPLRELALRLLASWRIRTQQQAQLSAEEQELMMNLSSAYLEWEQKTRQEGLREGERRMLLWLLTRRFGPLPQTLITRIEAITEANRLEQLAEALLTTADLQSFERLL